MKHFATVVSFMIALSAAAPAMAGQQPIWAVPTDLVTVIRVHTANGFSYAMVRDNSMRGHNVFWVTPGAHVANATVTHISANGVELSDGHVLRVVGAPTALAATQP